MDVIHIIYQIYEKENENKEHPIYKKSHIGIQELNLTSCQIFYNLSFLFFSLNTVLIVF